MCVQGGERSIQLSGEGNRGVGRGTGECVRGGDRRMQWQIWGGGGGGGGCKWRHINDYAAVACSNNNQG